MSAAGGEGGGAAAVSEETRFSVHIDYLLDFSILF